MSKKLFLCSIISTSLFITACNDPKAANKENFGKAISEYLATQSAVCINYPNSSFAIPKDSPLNNDTQIVFKSKDLANSWYQDTADKMTYLEQKGLFSKQEQTIQVDGFGQKQDIAITVYSPTDKVKPFIIEKEISGLGKSKEICTGKVELDSINTFTEPAERSGMKVSRVEYTIKTKELADWATDPNFSKLFKGLYVDIAEEQQKTTLILTNDGWKSERLMKGKF